MRILGIETSCDETAAAVVEITEQRNNQKTKQQVVRSLSCSVLSNVVASQVKIHAKTGGVVPEVAARAHAENIIPVIEEALKRVHPLLNPPPSMGRKDSGIDAVAVTAGPGLITSLLVGVETARTLAYLWKKPLVAVNHLEGHIYANFLPRQKIGKFPISNFQFPILCLIVSGGHTELVLMSARGGSAFGGKNSIKYKVIGATRDDAAGECFDKVAKILGLGYPGGPAIAEYARRWNFQFPISNFQTNSKSQIQNSKRRKNSAFCIQHSAFKFPRPMIDSPDFDFSFAGLKTAVLYFIKTLKHENMKTLLPRICYEFQEAAVDVLVSKTIRAAEKYKIKTVLLGGGVAANKRLRQRLREAIGKELSNTKCMIPDTKYTGDNAAMIAAAGYFHAQKKDFMPWQKLEADPNLMLT